LLTLLVRAQQCPIVQDLNAAKAARHGGTSSLTSQIFAVLFPFGPAANALLATLYISGPPNFLLALCPTNIDPSSLSVMVAFAVGGLLGDTLFHLLPEIFLGEDEPDRVRLVLVEPNRNLLLGVAILVGFMTFVAMDKGLRIATGGEGGHSHDHGHSHGTEAKAVSSSVDTSTDKVKSRKKAKENGAAVSAEKEEASQTATATTKDVNPSVKLGGYLNLMYVRPSASHLVSLRLTRLARPSSTPHLPLQNSHSIYLPWMRNGRATQIPTADINPY
jgi:solute carrier family 39 (zinc transporter), member 7